MRKTSMRSMNFSWSRTTTPRLSQPLTTTPTGRGSAGFSLALRRFSSTTNRTRLWTQLGSQTSRSASSAVLTKAGLAFQVLAGRS